LVEYRADLDATFAALADPTRRAILRQLGAGPARVTEIAQRFPVSLNAISKHLMVLERAGLIAREAQGRERVCRSKAGSLRDASLWLEEMREFWEQRLDALEKHVAAKRRRKK
jgi:DNA-binding transcriptional ArsR family regulator